MKINLSWLSQLRGEWEHARPYVIQQFEDLAAQISTGWNQEHNADGTQSKAASMTGNVVTTGGYGTFTGQHRVYLTMASDATLTTAVNKTLTWTVPTGLPDAPDRGWNVGPLFNSNSPTLFTALVEGLYLLCYCVQFEAVNATGVRIVELTVKGSTTHLTTTNTANFGKTLEGGLANGNTLTLSTVIPMSAGENVQLFTNQTSGGNLKVLSGFEQTWFQMTKIA